MAENQNYIGVAMGLDVTDLKAGLSEANKQIQLANSEFKAASSGMDDWSKSTEGLSAKVKQLDSVLTAQKSKLAGLQAEYEKVAAEQGENSEAARKLKVQMNNQQAVVNRTQREFDNYSDILSQAENGTIDLERATIGANGQIRDLGDSAEDAGEKVNEGFGSNATKVVVGGIAAITAAAVSAVGSFLSLAESTKEYRNEQAKLNAAFAQAGQTNETAKSTYDKLFRVIGETDQTVEAAQQIALLADSEKEAAKWAELATGVVGTFGDALQPETFYESANETLKLGEATGAYVQMLEGTGVNVEDFNANLAACTTESEKQAYILSVAEKAMGAAGTAYEEGAADIIAANEATARMNDATAELGAVAEPIMTAVKNGFADILVAVMDLIKNADFEQIKTNIENGFSTFINDILPKLVDGLKWVMDNADIIAAGIAGIGAAMLTMNVANMIMGVVKAFKAFKAAQEGATIAQWLLNIAMNANPIGLIVAAIAGLVAAFVILWNKSEGFREFWIGLWEGLKKAGETAGKAIKKLFGGIGEWLEDIETKFVSAGTDIVKGIWEGITGGASWLKKKITGFAGNVAGWFKDTFQINSPSKLMENEVGRYIGEGVGVGVVDSIPTVKKQLGKFTGFVADNLGGIKSGLSIDSSGAGAASGGRIATGNTVVHAGLTVNYNGTLSRKQIKQLESDNYTAIKTRLKAEGAF